MEIDLILDPSAEVWYGLVEYAWEEPDVEYEEPESRRRRSPSVIRISDYTIR